MMPLPMITTTAIPTHDDGRCAIPFYLIVKSESYGCALLLCHTTRVYSMYPLPSFVVHCLCLTYKCPICCEQLSYQCNPEKHTPTYAMSFAFIHNSLYNTLRFRIVSSLLSRFLSSSRNDEKAKMMAFAIYLHKSNAVYLGWLL